MSVRLSSLAHHLLGRHVTDLAFEGRDQRLLALVAVALGDSEVDDLDVTAEAHHDVARADVAVNDPEGDAVEIALLVHVREARADRERDAERVLQRNAREAPLGDRLDHGAQVLAVDVLPSR
jgi:hypothetical protein